MESLQKARKRGITYAVKATLVTEVAVAVLFFALLLSVTRSAQVFLDIFTYLGAVNVAVFVASSLLFAYLVGRKAGVKIIIKKKRHAWVGLVSGLKVVFFSSLICCLVALLLQATTGSVGMGWWLDYIMKPFAWMALVGLVPVIIAGIWFGYQVRRNPEH